ncbi:DRTGG domain-containing protein [Phascolarctobacterium sp.]|uniref:DRTGG domain-containing protein n=1 Tax=Phascolarctobacterium sp. TaxID=2049039 RepID=UPI00386CD401
MKLKDVQKLLDAKVLTGEDLLERPVESCCGSDMMSDVLAFTKSNTLLCTGLTNMQVVRTAEMTELSALVFVRGKVPDEDIVAEAAENGFPVLVTEHTLFEACGILYAAGIKGCSKRGK